MTRRGWLAATLLPLGLHGRPAAAAGRAWPQPTTRPAPADLSVVQLLAALRRGAVSPLEVTEAYLARIRTSGEELRAYITVTPEAARERARQLAAQDGRRRGPLFGLPIAHKDLFETAGVRTTAGSKLFEHHVPERDATLVARLAAAGAIQLGKTNTHELGGGVTTINPFFGTTHNPRDPDRIAGGSSGGSAAAVAARLAAAATGSDTGGSIRIPAAFCGCVGFKPTYGVLSTAGLLGASPTFDHAGFLTRAVSDVAPLLRATMGVDAADPSTVPAVPLTDAGATTLRGLRIGIPRSYFFDDLEAEVGQAMDAALARLSRAGAVLRDRWVPVDGNTMARVFDPIVVAEIRQTYQRDWLDRPALFSESFAGVFTAPVPTAIELAAAHRERRRFQVAMTRVFDDVDLLVLPTVPVVAPRIGGPVNGALILRNTWPFNAAHLPALSLPCGPTDRLPVGLQLVARGFDDGQLLRAGTLVEQVLG